MKYQEQPIRPRPLSRDRRYELRHNVFFAYSPRIREPVAFYSRRAYETWITLEADPRVTALCPYPDNALPRVPTLRGGHRTLEFAVWVRRSVEGRQQEELWDAPAADDCPTAADQAHSAPHYWTELRRWASNRGVVIRYRAPAELDEQAQWVANWEQILPFVRQAQQHGRVDLEEAVVRAFDQGRAVRLSELPAHLPHAAPNDLLAAAMSLLHKGRINAEALRQEPLHWHTEFRVSDGE